MNRTLLRGWSMSAAGLTAVAALVAGPGSATAATAPAADAVVLVNGAGQTVTAAEEQAAQATATKVRASDSWRNRPRGGPSLKTIIGPDGRVQVTSTTSAPYNMIVHLETARGRCSGFMVSRDTVLTAAHCLYDFAGRRWTGTPYTVRPGRNGGLEPYGSCTGSSNDTSVPTEWINTGQQRYDIGAIKLTCNIGDQTGWFNIFASDTYSQVGSSISTAGYPGDKPYGTMWRVGGSVNFQDAYIMAFSNDATEGQSGSPLYRFGSPGGCTWYCAAGIVTNNARDLALGNEGVRFNSSIMGHVNYWISLP
jgi:glutamyl endopeptidase